MWRKAVVRELNRQVRQPWRTISSRKITTASYSVNTILLRSLKEHYLQISKMNPPPKISPPSPYTVVKGALDSGSPVLKRTYRDEEINISVMRLIDIAPDGSGDDNSDDGINQFFLHVEICKPNQTQSLHFLGGLYPDALGIHSVSLRPKGESSNFNGVPNKYTGPVFEDIDEKLRDSLHSYIDERGINESLFPFLQAWLYVKDHRNLMRYFKTVGTFINDTHQGALQA